MKRIIITAVLITILILLCSSCTLVWTDRVLLIDIAKQRDIDSFSLISEPNYIEFQGEKWHVDPDNVNLYTPYGVIKTGE